MVGLADFSRSDHHRLQPNVASKQRAAAHAMNMSVTARNYESFHAVLRAGIFSHSAGVRWRDGNRTLKREQARASLRRRNVLADPVDQEVGNVEAVVVLHQHVRVALDADVGQHQ
jgi:hypothetical protein